VCKRTRSQKIRVVTIIKIGGVEANLFRSIKGLNEGIVKSLKRQGSPIEGTVRRLSEEGRKKGRTSQDGQEKIEGTASDR